MTAVTVKTQAELDAALADTDVYEIDIRSPYRSGYGFEYRPGTTVTAPDWAPTDACGAGLHFGPTPGHAEAYYDQSEAPRFLACRVKVAETVGITSQGATAKCKARSCEVLYEVDVHGQRIESVEAVA